MCDSSNKCQCNRDAAPETATSKFSAVLVVVKPIVVVVLILAAGVLQYKGVIDQATFNVVISVLGGGAIASLKSSQNRIERKTDRALRSLENK
jgi:hypothetical protein